MPRRWLHSCCILLQGIPTMILILINCNETKAAKVKSGHCITFLIAFWKIQVQENVAYLNYGVLLLKCGFFPHIWVALKGYFVYTFSRRSNRNKKFLESRNSVLPFKFLVHLPHLWAFLGYEKLLWSIYAVSRRFDTFSVLRLWKTMSSLGFWFRFVL